MLVARAVRGPRRAARRAARARRRRATCCPSTTRWPSRCPTGRTGEPRARHLRHLHLQLHRALLHEARRRVPDRARRGLDRPGDQRHRARAGAQVRRGGRAPRPRRAWWRRCVDAERRAPGDRHAAHRLRPRRRLRGRLPRGDPVDRTRGARIVDITHGIRRYAVRHGAIVLRNTLPYMPAGVHVAVVDPQVGTERRALALRSGDGRLLVGPDNGLLSLAWERCGGVDAGGGRDPLARTASSRCPRPSTGATCSRPWRRTWRAGAELADAGDPLDPDELARGRAARAAERGRRGGGPRAPLSTASATPGSTWTTRRCRAAASRLGGPWRSRWPASATWPPTRSTFADVSPASCWSTRTPTARWRWPSTAGTPPARSGLQPDAEVRLRPRMIGAPRVHHRLADSTNERAKALAAAGAPHGTLVTADEQTAGRGRQGRAGSPRRARRCSCRWCCATSADALPLAAAVAVCEAVPAAARSSGPTTCWSRAASSPASSWRAGPQEGWAVLGIGLNVRGGVPGGAGGQGLPGGAPGRHRARRGARDAAASLDVLARRAPGRRARGLAGRATRCGAAVRWDGGAGRRPASTRRRAPGGHRRGTGPSSPARCTCGARPRLAPVAAPRLLRPALRRLRVHLVGAAASGAESPPPLLRPPAPPPRRRLPLGKFRSSSRASADGLRAIRMRAPSSTCWASGVCASAAASSAAESRRSCLRGGLHEPAGVARVRARRRSSRAARAGAWSPASAARRTPRAPRGCTRPGARASAPPGRGGRSGARRAPGAAPSRPRAARRATSRPRSPRRRRRPRGRAIAPTSVSARTRSCVLRLRRRQVTR